MNALVRYEAWTKEAESGLDIALDGYAKFYEKQVNEGVADLFKWGDSWVILRTEVDEYKNKTELVVCCYQGSGLAQFVEYIKQYAKKRSLDAVRFHTVRGALGQWMGKSYGFKECERVYMLEIE